MDEIICTGCGQFFVPDYPTSLCPDCKIEADQSPYNPDLTEDDLWGDDEDCD